MLVTIKMQKKAVTLIVHLYLYIYIYIYIYRQSAISGLVIFETFLWVKNLKHISEAYNVYTYITPQPCHNFLFLQHMYGAYILWGIYIHISNTYGAYIVVYTPKKYVYLYAPKPCLNTLWPIMMSNTYGAYTVYL